MLVYELQSQHHVNSRCLQSDVAEIVKIYELKFLCNIVSWSYKQCAPVLSARNINALRMQKDLHSNLASGTFSLESKSKLILKSAGEDQEQEVITMSIHRHSR